MRIAWIGLGTMGEAMAGHLLEAGHDLAVHNRTREREEALAARGAAARSDAARGGGGRGARLHVRVGLA